MSFDLTGPFSKVDWAAESQMADLEGNQGASNKFNNCVPTAFQSCLLALGYQDVEPEVWTDQEYGINFTGGEDFSHAIDFSHKHFQNLPEIRVSNPRDTLAAIDAAGRAGFPTVLQCHCDRDAAFQDHYTGFFHMGIPVAYDGVNVAVRNVYWGKLHVLPVAFVKKMTWDPAGWMAVFARSIVPPPAPPPPPAIVDPRDQKIKDLEAAANTLSATIKTLSVERDAYKMGWNHLSGTFAEVQASLPKP